MEPRYLTVSQINAYMKNLVERDGLLYSVCVKGELSNYKIYPSGHHYFTLKDPGGALRCVMFRSSADRIRFRPENGMQVLAAGRMAVYERDGVYQLYCTALIPEGIGDLHAAFEQLKEKLSAEGLFSEAHKKPLPKYPHTIAIVTSSAGAALRDMLRILRKRYPLARIRLLPVRVQGVEAPGEIASAIGYANRYSVADLIITGRGGGSIEDLWAFNEEIVARAVYDSQIPVISAVGHEPDVTICDYAADRRAATPSNGAELAVPDQMELREGLRHSYARMETVMLRMLKEERKKLKILAESRVLQDPENYLADRRVALDHMEKDMIAAAKNLLSRKKQSFVRLSAGLDAMSPLKVLSRGYGMAKNSKGEVLRSIRQIQPGDHFTMKLYDGEILAAAEEIKEHESE